MTRGEITILNTDPAKANKYRGRLSKTANIDGVGLKRIRMHAIDKLISFARYKIHELCSILYISQETYIVKNIFNYLTSIFISSIYMRKIVFISIRMLPSGKTIGSLLALANMH